MIKVSNNLVKLASSNTYENTALLGAVTGGAIGGFRGLKQDLRRQELRDKEVLDGLYKNSSVRDYLASYVPVITGLGGGFAGLHASDGSVPVALISSILGSLGGIPIMYLLSSEQQKKKYRKNPATAVGSFGLVF